MLTVKYRLPATTALLSVITLFCLSQPNLAQTAESPDLFGWAPYHHNALLFLIQAAGEITPAYLEDPGGELSKLNGPYVEFPPILPSTKEKYLFWFQDSDHSNLYDLYLVDRKTREKERLTHEMLETPYSLTSPSGNRLIYSSRARDGVNLDLVLVNLKGEKTRLTESSGKWRPHQWLPDDSGVIVSRQNGNAHNRPFFLYSFADGSLVPVDSQPGENWSRLPIVYDKLLYYITERPGQPGTLAVWDLVQRGPIRRLTDPGVVGRVTFYELSQNGRQLIFSSVKDEHQYIYFWALSQDKPREVLSTREPIKIARLSPDGSKIAYELGNKNVYVHDINTHVATLWRDGRSASTK